MTTASVRSQARKAVGEFLAWSAERSEEARHELVRGLPVRPMAPTSILMRGCGAPPAHTLRQGKNIWKPPGIALALADRYRGTALGDAA